MVGISDDAIRNRAYAIWEREGRPAGRDFDHWVQAQVELAAEASNHRGTRSAAKPSKPKAVTPNKMGNRAPARAARAKKQA